MRIFKYFLVYLLLSLAWCVVFHQVFLFGTQRYMFLLYFMNLSLLAGYTLAMFIVFLLLRLLRAGKTFYLLTPVVLQLVSLLWLDNLLIGCQIGFTLFALMGVAGFLWRKSKIKMKPATPSL